MNGIPRKRCCSTITENDVEVCEFKLYLGYLVAWMWRLVGDNVHDCSVVDADSQHFDPESSRKLGLNSVAFS